MSLGNTIKLSSENYGGDDLIFITTLDGAGVQSDCCDLDNVVDQDPATGEASMVSDLVERFDIEPFPDFSAKLANFTGLVLFCIDANFCK